MVDAQLGKVVATIPVGRRPLGIALTHDGTTFFTANGLSDDMSVIDVASRRVIATIPVGKRQWGVAVVEK